MGDLPFVPESGLRKERSILTGRQKSAAGVVCAEQRVDREGSSPSGARMRSAISERGGNASRAGREEGMEKPKRARRRKLDTAKADLKPPLAVPGGQGVHREVESEGHEEKYRAVIDGGHPEDEPVGQRWGKVEPALWGRRRSHPPTVSRCLRAARYGRSRREPRRTRPVRGWHRSKQTYKRERSGEQRSVSRRTAV